MPYRLRLFSVPCALAIATLLSACSSTSTPLYQQEKFDAAASPYARTFHAKSDATCEAARRALLSQGYIASPTRPDAIDGSKNFQPSNDSHVVIEFHVVCADADADGGSSIAYVNAVEDRYTLKKTNTSASVGFSVFGSLSLPIGSSDDSMVKIASETIPAGVFYERFFNLVDHFLKIDPTLRDRATVKAAEKERVAPLPEPAPTHQGEPLKLTTPIAPTPPAPPIPVAVPASVQAPQPPGAGPASDAGATSKTPGAAASPASAPGTTSAPSPLPASPSPLSPSPSSPSPSSPSAPSPSSPQSTTTPTQNSHAQDTTMPAAKPAAPSGAAASSGAAAPTSASAPSGASAAGTN